MALEVGLHHTDQVADQQRGNRHKGQHLLPICRQRQQAIDQQAHHHGKGGQLGALPRIRVIEVGAPWYTSGIHM